MKNNVDDLLNKKIKMFEEIDRLYTQNSSNQENNDSNLMNSINKKKNAYNEKANFNSLYHFNNEQGVNLRIQSNNRKLRSDNPSGDNTTKETDDKFDNKKKVNPHSKTNISSINNFNSLTSQTLTHRDKKTNSIKESSNQINTGSNINTHRNNAIHLKKNNSNLLSSFKSKSRSRTPEIKERTISNTFKITKNNEREFRKNTNERSNPKLPINLIKDTYSREKKKTFEEFNFKPKLNTNSIKMAQKLEPSSSRLFSLKKKRQALTPENNYNNRSPSVNNSRLSNNSKLCHNLYDQAKAIQLKKESNAKLKKIEDEKKLSTLMKPLNVRPRSKSGEREVIKSSCDPDSFFNMQEQWKKSKLIKTDRLREIAENDKLDNCTFKPQIKSLELKDDEEFINRNLDQILEYVNRRKKSLGREKSNKDYQEKVFITGKNFVNKPTIPKEFNFAISLFIK